VVAPIFIGGLLVARLLPPQLETDPAKLVLALVTIRPWRICLLPNCTGSGLCDEMQQRMRLSIYTVALALTVATAWPLWILQRAGFLLGVEYIDAVGTAVLYGASIGWLWQKRRYG
jgi:hypothetical protein